jgi:hypothetical protein
MPKKKRGTVKAEKGDLLHNLGHTVRRSTVSIQSIFRHEGQKGPDMNYRLK